MSARHKKLINQPHDILREMLEGFSAAYPEIVRLEHGLVLRAQPKSAGKVGLVIGNGTGHEPAMIGFVGQGLFDVNVPGDIFAAPGSEHIVRGIRAADRGGGVLLCVSHHAGDLLNAELAMARCAAEGIPNVEMVVLYDDVSSAPKGREPERRGTAGLFFTWKLVGAYAEMGASLEECKAMAERIRDHTRTLAVALTSGTNPLTGQVMFELPDDEIEIGMGVHGEVGQGRRKLTTADATIDMMLPPILDDLPFVSGDEVLVLFNNSGSMTQMELFILYRRVALVLQERGISVYGTYIGSYATTQEMAGFALSLCKIDQVMSSLWDAPARGAGFQWG